MIVQKDRTGHIKLDMALGFMKQPGNLSEKDRQRIDKWGDFTHLGMKKGLTADRKSLILNGSGGRI